MLGNKYKLKATETNAIYSKSWKVFSFHFNPLAVMWTILTSTFYKLTLKHTLLFHFLVLEKIRSAVGSSQLLMSQKVQQFFRLCQQNMVCDDFIAIHLWYNEIYTILFTQTYLQFIAYLNHEVSAGSCAKNSKNWAKD